MKKSRVVYIEALLNCPHCNSQEQLKVSSPNTIHQGSHMRECWNCFKDYYWSFQVQVTMDGMPDYIDPLRSY